MVGLSVGLGGCASTHRALSSTEAQVFSSPREILKCLSRESGVKEDEFPGIRVGEYSTVKVPVEIPAEKLEGVIANCGFGGQRASQSLRDNGTVTVGVYLAKWEIEEPYFPNWPSIVTVNDRGYYVGSVFRTVESISIGSREALVVSNGLYAGELRRPFPVTLNFEFGPEDRAHKIIGLKDVIDPQ